MKNSSGSEGLMRGLYARIREALAAYENSLAEGKLRELSSNMLQGKYLSLVAFLDQVRIQERMKLSGMRYSIAEELELS